MIPFHGSRPAKPEGHYESWFLRGNHPHKPQAFWIRFTRFIPGDDRRKALGEIWAIWFDGEQNKIVAVKEEFPHNDCHFDVDHLQVNIGTCALQDFNSHGHASLGGHRISWSMDYEERCRGRNESILFLPESFYEKRLPRAKSVISRPQIVFSGTLQVDATQVSLDGWLGSENHNWGSRHTDQYAWGQIVSFDNNPDAFLECITARVKLGPVFSPWMSIAVLRIDEEDLMFNTPGTAFRAKGNYDFFHWQLSTSYQHVRLDLKMQAPPSSFAALDYYNPSGGSKTCLNSKIACCQATLSRPDQAPITLYSAHGAAFEILTDRSDHGRPLMT